MNHSDNPISGGVFTSISIVIVVFCSMLIAAPATTRPSGKATQSGPKPLVFDDLENFRTAIFASNGSGSMLVNGVPLKDQLTNGINVLTTNQSFNIIFFVETPVTKFTSLAKEKLLSASSQNKESARAFLRDIRFTGIPDPIPGIKEGFRQNPEVIYIISEGSFPDNELVQQTIHDLNKDHAVKIYTILFASNFEAADAKFVDFMRSLAKENGGKFKLVIRSDLE